MVEMVILSALHNFLKNVRNYDSTLQCCKIASFLTLLEYNADFNGKNSSGNENNYAHEDELIH